VVHEYLSIIGFDHIGWPVYGAKPLCNVFHAVAVATLTLRVQPMTFGRFQAESMRL
jgi:hypothetical protein